MTDEIMLDRQEADQNRYWSRFGRGGMYSYDPEEEEIFRDLYREPHKCKPNIIDEGGSLNGRGYCSYDLDRI